MFSLKGSGIGEPSLYHALVVIFLEFFAWGLLTTPMITVIYCSSSIRKAESHLIIFIGFK